MSRRTGMMMVPLLTAAAGVAATAASVSEPPSAQACSGIVTIELELTYDTVIANDQIPNATEEICVGDKITWQIHNKSGLGVEVEIDQFHPDKNPNTSRIRLTSTGGRRNSSGTDGPGKSRERSRRMNSLGASSTTSSSRRRTSGQVTIPASRSSSHRP